MSKRNWRDLENRITRLQSRYERDAAIAQVKRNETYQTIRSNWSKIALWLGGIAIATYLCVGGVNWISNIGSGATSQREEPAAEVYNSPTVEEVVETDGRPDQADEQQ